MTQSQATTSSRKRTDIFHSLVQAESERLEIALSPEVIATIGHPSSVFHYMLAVVVSVAMARWWAPAHAAIGLQDALLPLAMATAVVATGLASWGLARAGSMWLARVVQFFDFIVWGLLPIAIGYLCTEAVGVIVAVAIHGMMGLRWALFVRESWVLRGIVLATWGPLLGLSAQCAAVPPIAIATAVLFIIANHSSNAHRAETEERDRERLREAEAREEHLRQDFKALSREFGRIRGERDRLAGKGER